MGTKIAKLNSANFIPMGRKKIIGIYFIVRDSYTGSDAVVYLQVFASCSLRIH